MTYKEFLNIVTFEEVAPHIVNMYPEAKDSLGWFKLHYDMLKQTTPKRHDDSNGDVCHITMKDWDDGTGPHLDAFPMEGDLWEHSLTKEIVLDADVHVTDAEIVACCLWHTSFYGFTKGQKKEFANIDFKSKVKELKTIILNNGGYVPSKRELLPFKKQEMIEDTKKIVWYGDKNVNRTKRKRLFRQAFMETYYERMEAIGSFIVQVLPALSVEANSFALDQLCKLFFSGRFATVTIQSYADGTTNAVSYMADLVCKYDMLPHGRNAIVHLVTGHSWTNSSMLNPEETELLRTIADSVMTTKDNNGTVDFILDYNPALGQQIEITVVATDISVSE